MKKFFEKYDLIKVSGILVLLTVVLTWLIPSGYFQSGELIVEDITRVGLTDFFYFGMLGMYYFCVLVTFLFVLGGFYQVLSTRAGYRTLVKNISEKLKNFAIPVVLIVSLLFAILGSLVNEYFPLLAFIPFVIAILNRMKVDKISSFVATFGGLLIGTLGSTASTKVAGYLTNNFGVEAADVLTTQTILFVIAYLLLAGFTFLRMKKQSGKKQDNYDMFEVETKDSKTEVPKTWTYAVGIILFAIVTVLAYLPWSTWEITLFADATKWVNELSIADIPIFAYIFGEFTEFGKWDIFMVQYVMIFATLLIHWFGHMSLSEIFKCYGEGFKKIGKVVIILLVVYLILELNVMFPILPVIADWFANLTDGFNALITFISASVTSLFTVEMQYVVQLVGPYHTNAFADAANSMVIIFQTAFGFISFFAPSSIILMLGLSYLDIPYKDWLKFIWKFLVTILAVIIVIILIIA